MLWLPIVDIDNSFPSEMMSPLALFSISNEVAEYRTEALNTYLLSVCGCRTIMNRCVWKSLTCIVYLCMSVR